MWLKLREVHSKSAPNSRIAALNHMFSVCLQPDEILTELAGRIQGQMQRVQSLRPQSGYDIQKLNKELKINTMLCALPHDEYGAFVSSVQSLSDFSEDAILQAFRSEDTQRRGIKTELEAAAAAAARVI